MQLAIRRIGRKQRLSSSAAPEAVRFAIKPKLAIGMIERAMAANVLFAWATADSIYGVDAVEMALRRLGKGYLLGVGATSQFNSWNRQPVVAGTAAQNQLYDSVLDNDRAWSGREQALRAMQGADGAINQADSVLQQR